MKYFVSIILSSFLFSLYGQNTTTSLQEKESELYQILNELRSVRDDASIKRLNQQLKSEFLEVLNDKEAFDYPFSSLSSIGKIYSKDNLIRIFSWNVQYEDFSYGYEAFILKKDTRKDRVSITELTGTKQNLYAIQDEKIEVENWYGALYYEIIDVQRNNRTFYTLLGFDGNNNRSSIKLLDVLYFSGSTPYFGSPIFESENRKKNRVIFEYNSEATMSLRYDAKRNKIIFDHLSPEAPSMKDFKEFYVPDMSYDAYTWNGKFWELKEDIIAINEERSEIQLKAYDSKLDTVVSIPVKNKWINPEDPDAPIDGGRHEIALPDDVPSKKDKGAKKKEKKEKANSKTPKSNVNPNYPGVSTFEKKRKSSKKGN